jgi:hypothetical protein
MTKSRNVPGQAEGYYLQETRFFFHLLNAESGDIVSLECFGDVATAHSDGSITSEEDKSAIKNNPITDKSINLWKTFYNWVLSVQEGSLDIKQTRFIIYVPRPDFKGKFIEAFNEADDIKEAKGAISNIKNQLWGKYPEYDLKNKLSKTISDYINHLFSNEELFAEIIFQFKYEQGDNAGYSEIDLKIKDSLVPNEYIETYRNYMMGWIKKRIDDLISQGKPAQISRDEFIIEGEKYLRKLNKDGILKSVSITPTEKIIKNQIKQKPTYIRQLDYVNLEFDEKISAVTDFLMAETDRYHWIEKGFIHPKSAEEFENNLKLTWTNIKGGIIALHARLEPDRQGAAIYFKCKQHNAKIENHKLEPQFISGTYHLLADKPVLGWHPEWKELISEDDKSGEK